MDLFKKILNHFDDGIILDLVRINDYEQLKAAFDESQYDVLDLLMSRFKTSEPYRECIQVLKVYAQEHHSWLEIHSYLSSIQQMTLSFTEPHITKELPEYEEVLTQYPQAQWPKVMYLFQLTLKNLTFMPEQFTQYLNSLKTILQMMMHAEVPVEHLVFPSFHFNLSILELIIRHEGLAIPLMELEKWRDYDDFLKITKATLEHDFKTIFSILPRSFENKELEKIAYHSMIKFLNLQNQPHSDLSRFSVL